MLQILQNLHIHFILIFFGFQNPKLSPRNIFINSRFINFKNISLFLNRIIRIAVSSKSSTPDKTLVEEKIFNFGFTIVKK